MVVVIMLRMQPNIVPTIYWTRPAYLLIHQPKHWPSLVSYQWLGNPVLFLPCWSCKNRVIALHLAGHRAWLLSGLNLVDPKLHRLPFSHAICDGKHKEVIRSRRSMAASPVTWLPFSVLLCTGQHQIQMYRIYPSTWGHHTTHDLSEVASSHNGLYQIQEWRLGLVHTLPPLPTFLIFITTDWNWHTTSEDGTNKIKQNCICSLEQARIVYQILTRNVKEQHSS